MMYNCLASFRKKTSFDKYKVGFPREGKRQVEDLASGEARKALFGSTPGLVKRKEPLIALGSHQGNFYVCGIPPWELQRVRNECDIVWCNLFRLQLLYMYIIYIHIHYIHIYMSLDPECHRGTTVKRRADGDTLLFFCVVKMCTDLCIAWARPLI